VFTIKKTDFKEIRIQKKEYKGFEYIDIRTFYKDKETGEWKYSKQGVTIKPSQIDDLIEALFELKEGENG